MNSDTQAPPYITPNDLCELRTKRKGWVKATVVSVRPLRTGRVEVKFVADEGGDYSFTTDPRYASESIRYLGPGLASPEVIQGHQERDDHRDSLKSARAGVGSGALDKWNPNPGDKVTIEYRGGIQRTEVVTGVNYKTGKVGVAKETRTTPGEQDRLEVAFHYMNQVTGTNVKPPRERDTRWIPANQIVGVTRKVG